MHGPCLGCQDQQQPLFMNWSQNKSKVGSGIRRSWFVKKAVLECLQIFFFKKCSSSNKEFDH
jgi:hypothetical protein